MPRRPFLASSVQGITKRLDRQLREIGRADSPEMRAAGKIMKKVFRQVLGVRGNGKPSSPGEPPRKQSGQLVKSVRDGVVGDVRRVAVTWFTAPLLEAGFNSTLPLPSGKRRKRKGGVAKRRVVMAARPFRQRAIDLAADDMAEAFRDLGVQRFDAGGLDG